jgi:transcriptional regulator with XRE-family HTH domain
VISGEQSQYQDMLRAIKLQRRWTQKRLAFELCVSSRTIRNWEKGATQPNARDIMVLEAMLARKSEIAGSSG